MGGGRGMGGEQLEAARLIEHLQATLAEKESQEREGDGAGSQGQSHQDPSFEGCIANIGLWLQVSQICQQGLQEAIAEAQGAFPELSALGELGIGIQRDGPFHALLSSAAGGASAPVTLAAEPTAAPTAAQTQPQADPDVLRTLMELIKAQSELQAGPSQQAAQVPSAPASTQPQPPPTLPQIQFLQQYFANPSPQFNSWNALITATDQLPTSASPPLGEGGAAGPAGPAAAAGDAINLQGQGDYPNSTKRPRLGSPTDHMATTTAPFATAASMERQCSNCGAVNTPFWRKDKYSKLSLCNACGLYAAKNDHARPFRLWKEGQNVDHLYAAEAAAAAATAAEAGAVSTSNVQNEHVAVGMHTNTGITGSKLVQHLDIHALTATAGDIEVAASDDEKLVNAEDAGTAAAPETDAPDADQSKEY